MDPNQSHDQDGTWAPGTVTLEDLHRSTDQIVLHPVPSSDPNDPLNWSPWRKTLNFTLVCFYVLMTFVQLDIGFTAWGDLQTQLNFSINILNAASAANYAGLAIGCVFFVPLVHKYGRRPLYLFSTALQLAACIWTAKTYTRGDLIGSSLISGLGGAISETIVQITIADLFFVHQHAAMNSWYLLFTCIGAFLGPVASGYIVVSQGWRWMWWWCVILFTINLALIVVLFEESKYVSVIIGRGSSPTTQLGQAKQVQGDILGDKGPPPFPRDAKEAESAGPVERTHSTIDRTIRVKTYRERLALVTKTDGSMRQHFYQPVVALFTFPAVAYAALTYGSLLAWFAILTSVQATYLLYPPYNFTAVGVGLMNIPPFVGAFVGFFVGGYLNDRSIMWLSQRNGGIYEPEMRLWLALPSAVITPAGILMFGLGLTYGVSWPLLAVGFGFFGFGFVVSGDIALAYAMDCYQDIIGDALVGVVFTRNAFSVVVLFALTPWITGMGLQNMHILTSVLCFAILLIPVPLLRWGKKARIATTKAYTKMALRQPTHRAL